MRKIFCLNGSNLNMLGQREPEIYGFDTLGDIEDMMREVALQKGCDLVFEQTNHEGGLVDLIQRGSKEADGIILNAAAYTHTSLAVADAVKSVHKPIIEVHLSNVYKREEIRHTSLIAPHCTGIITGFGIKSYLLALKALID